MQVNGELFCFCSVSATYENKCMQSFNSGSSDDLDPEDSFLQIDLYVDAVCCYMT